jgi:4-diphosphocytidyl-2-C-methyl-D-erythritol kinase
VTLALPARAKVNLDLEVLGRRADGLHDLRTRVQAIELHDLLEAEPADRTSLNVTGLEVKGAGRNSVLVAHQALEEVVHHSLPTRFRLHKRIPPGSGLGGASSDAAAALRALVAMHRLEVDLATVAPRVGADVTFFLRGGCALLEGSGERFTPALVRPAWFVIAWPDVELSTADVYRAWDQVGGDGPNRLRRAAAHVDRRVDDFESKLGPGWQMTGSGSAFFRACGDEGEAAAQAGKLDCWTAVTHTAEAWA